jgi:hypothetical protein
VQAHLDVVSPRDHPRGDLAADERARLEDLDLVALVEELDGRGEAREAGADDGDLELGRVLWLVVGRVERALRRRRKEEEA